MELNNVWHFPLANWQMWSHFGSTSSACQLSLHINYTSKKGESLLGFDKWKRKMLLARKVSSSWACSLILNSLYAAIFWRAIFWQVWGGAHLLSIFPPSSACSLKRNWPFWKTCLQLHQPCYYFPSVLQTKHYQQTRINVPCIQLQQNKKYLDDKKIFPFCYLV